jgi:RNA polymerase sigma-70 factor (ECF subfamily)
MTACRKRSSSWLGRAWPRTTRRRTTHEQTAAVAPRTSSAGADGPDTTLELTDLLSKLEPSDREIVVLRVWGQLSWEEIASVVGGSKSTAQRNYVQALQQLRKLGEPNHA